MNDNLEIPQVHISRYENEKYTEQFYLESEDPWNNKGKYIECFKGVYDGLPIKSSDSIFIYDIGCGGGNVLEGLISNISKVESITVSGVDISPTAISRLNSDIRFKDMLAEPFMCDSISRPDWSLPRSVINLARESTIAIFSVVDTFYYIQRDFMWRSTADRLVSQVPQGSIILVADSAGTKSYRDYYKNNKSLILSTEGQSVTPIVPKSEGHRAKFLKWSIYIKA